MSTVPGPPLPPPITDGTHVGEVRDGYRWNGSQWVLVTTPGYKTPQEIRDEENKRKLLYALAAIIALILLGLLIWWIADAVSDDDDADNDDDNVTAVEPTPLAGLNSPVQNGDFRFVVVGVAPDVESVGTGDNAVTPDGSFTLVTLNVTNTGGEPVAFSEANVEAIDSNGDNLDADGDAYAYTVNGATGFEGDVASNQTITTTVPFDVADSATLDKVVVKEPATSGGEEIDVS